jgi:DNA polymerase/3'-5' exonuclease PolX
MEYHYALELAEKYKAMLAPHCDRIEIAGSIRRMKIECRDIELVAIPKPYEIGLFASGIATIVNQWQKVKGELPCWYTQRMLPEGIKLDLFFAEPGNFGFQYAIRTGSAEYSHNVLGFGWTNAGYFAEHGYLYKLGTRHEIREEKDLFDLIGIPFVEPTMRYFKGE